MKKTQKLNVGDKIDIFFYGEMQKATVLRTGFQFSNPAFNTYTVFVESIKERMEVCWNPMVKAFTGFDR